MVKTQTLLLCIIGLTGNIAGVSSHGLPDKATAYALQARHLPAVRLGARHLAQKRLVGRSLDVVSHALRCQKKQSPSGSFTSYTGRNGRLR